MKTRPLNKEDKELIQLAKDLIKKLHSKRSSVAACLRTKNGRIFKGVNIFIEGSTPCSIDAEYVAIGTMIAEGVKGIDTIVAIHLENGKLSVIPPCGHCRQFISEFGNPWVIFNGKEKTRLSDLYPFEVKSDY